MEKAVRDRRWPDGLADVVPTQRFGSLPPRLDHRTRESLLTSYDQSLFTGITSLRPLLQQQPAALPDRLLCGLSETLQQPRQHHLEPDVIVRDIDVS